MIDSSFKFAGIAGAMALAISASVVAQDAVQWRVEDGGNGHWYEARQFTPEQDPGGTDRWYLAKELCEARGGHLTTITSAGENSHLWSVVVPTMPAIPGPGAGPMLGGWNIDGTWRWREIGDTHRSGRWVSTTSKTSSPSRR